MAVEGEDRVAGITFANKVLDYFDAKGLPLYLVGGSVRDYLLNKDIIDFDFATPCLPNQVVSALDASEYDDFSIRFGTIKTIFEGRPIEITTFRKEGKYSKRRHPTQIEFIEDMNLDSNRRDFTINALYLDSSGKIYDFHNGQEDLKNKIIRMIGDADIRIKEDPVRILRALRFKLCLGFTFDSKLEKAIYDNIGLIKEISSTRLIMELNKFRKTSSDEKIIEELKDYQIEYILDK